LAQKQKITPEESFSESAIDKKKIPNKRKMKKKLKDGGIKKYSNWYKTRRRTSHKKSLVSTDAHFLARSMTM
jgi:hypothetical protein